MSIFRTIDPADASVYEGEASLSAIAGAARDTALYVDNFNARLLTETEAFDEAVKGVREATGIELENPRLDTQSTPLHRDPVRGDPFKLWDKRIGEIIEQHPDKADLLSPFQLEGIQKAAREKARRSAERYDALSSTRDDWAGFGAGVAGGVSGALQDPVTLLTLPLGLGAGGARTVAGKVLATTWREALVAGATETAVQPFVQKWREDAGLPHGLAEGLKNIGMATALGGVVGGTLRGAIETPGVIRRGWRRRLETSLPKPDPEKIVDDLLPVRDSLPPATRAAVDVFDENRAVMRAIRSELGADMSADFGRMLERADRFAQTLDAGDPEDFARFLRERELAEDPRLAGELDRARAELEAAQKAVAELEGPLSARTAADTLERIDTETAARMRAIEDELKAGIPAKRRADLEAERASIIDTIGKDVLERTEREFRIGPEKQLKRARKKLREARKAHNSVQRTADARAGGRLEAGRAVARSGPGRPADGSAAPAATGQAAPAAPSRAVKPDPFEPDSPEAADQIAALESQLEPEDELADMLFVQEDGRVTAESRTVAEALEEADRGNFLSDLVKACKLS